MLFFGIFFHLRLSLFRRTTLQLTITIEQELLLAALLLLQLGVLLLQAVAAEPGQPQDGVDGVPLDGAAPQLLLLDGGLELAAGEVGGSARRAGQGAAVAHRPDTPELVARIASPQ